MWCPTPRVVLAVVGIAPAACLAPAGRPDCNGAGPGLGGGIESSGADVRDGERAHFTRTVLEPCFVGKRCFEKIPKVTMSGDL